MLVNGEGLLHQRADLVERQSVGELFCLDEVFFCDIEIAIDRG